MAEFANIRACVFDAYGTLFDFNAAVAGCRGDLGNEADRLSEIWRTKQLQYTWLRGLMGRHADFWQVTTDALDFALDSVRIDDPALRQKLLDLYWKLDAYDEVPAVLRRLKDLGLRTAILSNGTPEMLEAAADHAGIRHSLDEIISIETVGVFKPHPAVYKLAETRLGLDAGAIAFSSSNAWDANAAAAFGFQVAWINRTAQPPERLPWQPQAELRSLAELVELVGA